MYFLSEARHVCVSLLKVTFVTDNGKFPISITRNHLKNFIAEAWCQETKQGADLFKVTSVMLK